MEQNSHKCQLCETDTKLLKCVGCQMFFCSKHSRAGYLNLQDQKGHSCGKCIQRSLVYPGGMSTLLSRFRAELLSQTIPNLERRIDEIVRRTVQQDLPPVITQTVNDSRREIEELSNQIILRLLGENTVLDITQSLSDSLKKDLTELFENTAEKLRLETEKLMTSAKTDINELFGNSVKTLEDAIRGHKSELSVSEHLSGVVTNEIVPHVSDVVTRKVIPRLTIWIGLVWLSSNLISIFIAYLLLR